MSAMFAAPPYLFVVHPGVKAGSIKELIALAKGQPGKMNYGSTGGGAASHLATELFKAMAAVDIVHVPYKNAAQGTGDVIAGQIPINITNTPFVIAPIQAGRLRALAVASAKRQSLLPDVPTMQESGVPDFEVNSWYGLCAPAGTPAPILDKVHADLRTVLRMPEIQQRLKDLVIEVAPNSPQEFAQFMRAETARWARVIKDARIAQE